MNKLFVGGLIGLLLITGCSSVGSKTQFYSLFAAKEQAAGKTNAQVAEYSLGIGPIILPEFMDNPSVVSTTRSQQVRISGRHAWAGNLKETISRVLTADLSVLLENDRIWQFPWDARIRPDYQLRIVFNRFDGERGGRSDLVANWVLIDTRSNQSVLTRTTRMSQVSTDESVSTYVQSLNKLLNSYAEKMADEVNAHLLSNSRLTGDTLLM